MRSKTQRTGVGRHRKINTSQTAKGRIALVTVAAGAVSSAGMGGAAAASFQANEGAKDVQEAQTSDVDVALAADSNEMTAGSSTGTELTELAPQILTIPEVKPISNISEQIDKAVSYSQERAQADEAARAPSTSKPTEGILTSGFASRWGDFHSGLDIANSEGTPIRAVMDGVVLDSGPASGYGNWIRIKHEDGSVSLYGHMSSLDVSAGQKVTAGQKIAGMGNLGFSTGTHLHFEIHSDGNTPVDPQSWLAERGISL